MSRSEQRRQARESGADMKKLYIVLAVVAAVGIGAVGYSVSSGRNAATAPIAVAGLDDDKRLVELAQALGQVVIVTGTDLVELRSEAFTRAFLLRGDGGSGAALQPLTVGSATLALTA